MTKKIVCSDNPAQNIWKKVKKSSKIGQDQRTLISAFAYFLPKFYTWKDYDYVSTRF